MDYFRARIKVLTIGTFDVLHYGHIDFLRMAAQFGQLTVGVNTDEFASTFKKPPVMSLEERVYAVEQQGYKTEVNDSSGRELILQLQPHVLVVGSDWAKRDYYAQIDVDQDFLDDMGIIMAYVPYVQKSPISSSEIKRRIREG